MICSNRGSGNRMILRRAQQNHGWDGPCVLEGPGTLQGHGRRAGLAAWRLFFAGRVCGCNLDSDISDCCTRPGRGSANH